jgi:hypothetical protein
VSHGLYCNQLTPFVQSHPFCSVGQGPQGAGAYGNPLSKQLINCLNLKGCVSPLLEPVSQVLVMALHAAVLFIGSQSSGVSIQTAGCLSHLSMTPSKPIDFEVYGSSLFLLDNT